MLWRPFGTLLDPPGMPAELHADVVGSGREIPTGWGWTKASHVAAFAMAPGAGQPRKRGPRSGRRQRNGEGGSEEQDSDGMDESSVDDGGILDMGSSSQEEFQREWGSEEEDSEEEDSEEESSDVDHQAGDVGGSGGDADL